MKSALADRCRLWWRLFCEDFGYQEETGWHAQVVVERGDEGSERLDVDRAKGRELWVHRHPLGEPNDVRQPAAPLMHPDAWVEHLEELITEHYGY